ncbi:MAG: ATP-binding cassette domain-containing protein [Gammaproteobacteria bacterium]|nr:ATP-binding cassette domain-containing protein [Gammaproteobacteria bacterium]
MTSGSPANGAGLTLRGGFSRPDGFELAMNLALPDHGVSALIGTSGSGKSTVLRITAGLESAPSFSVSFNGNCWDGVPAHRRPVSMTLQQPALFPHLNVLDNLKAVPLAGPIEEAVALFGLGALTGRRPHELSGGQQQRVALARAFLKPAELLLLDEPLSALDAVARRNLAPMVARMCRELQRPVVYVTHSLPEVLQVADHLAILENGRIIGAGTPEQVVAELDHPLSPLIDSGAILDCEFASYDADNDLSELGFGGQELRIRGDLRNAAGPIRVQIPARDVGLSLERPGATSFLNCLPVRVQRLKDAPDGTVFVDLDCAGQTLRSRITRLSRQNLELEPGKALFALIKSVALDIRI